MSVVTRVRPASPPTLALKVLSPFGVSTPVPGRILHARSVVIRGLSSLSPPVFGFDFYCAWVQHSITSPISPGFCVFPLSAGLRSCFFGVFCFFFFHVVAVNQQRNAQSCRGKKAASPSFRGSELREQPPKRFEDSYYDRPQERSASGVFLPFFFVCVCVVFILPSECEVIFFYC